MKKISILLVIALGYASAYSQALVNNYGTQWFIQPGAIVSVRTNSVHNFSGSIQNGGDFLIEGDLVNDGTVTGDPSSPTGLYKVLGDWINNGTTDPHQDSVWLYGDNQLIGGTVPSYFYKLKLTGPQSAVKVQGLDAYVANTLDLSDVELATNQYNMVVSSTLPAAILNSTTGGSEEDYGFVSSLDTGKLIRYTNSTSAYHYPLGTPTSTGLPFYYRPLDVTPSSPALNVYGSRLVKDPTGEGYSIDFLDDSLCKVNPLYYHNITHNGGNSPADLKFYFDAANDRPWTDVAHWENNRWNYTEVASSGFGGGYNTVEIQDWNDYDPFQFALASKQFRIDAGPDYYIFDGESVDINPTTDATNIASNYWTPDTYLDNPYAWNVTSTPHEDMTYTIYAVNELGCEAHDSMKIFIKPADLLIPTAFSPNNDGVNDVYRVIRDNVSQFRFQIFNRWGEKVFETTDINDGWDGTFRDRPQPMGVFTWQIWFKLSGSDKQRFKSGNVTLVR